MPAHAQSGTFSLSLHRVRQLLIRRRWLIMLTFISVSLLGIAILYAIPNSYSSEATILVVQQQIPERYVVPTSNTDISTVLEAMTQEVLSRPRLTHIIRELKLYPKQSSWPEERLVDMMRAHVDITPFHSNPERRDVNAFKISFLAPTPTVAQAVTTRLTRLFIEQNIKTRSDQATTTIRFLREQLSSAQQKLAEQETLLRDYKMAHLGELPEQQQGNLTVLAGLQAQLDNVMAGQSRAQQQRLYLESLLTEYSRLNGSVSTPEIRQVETPLERAQQELKEMHGELRRLLSRYTEDYPDVIGKRREIEARKALISTLVTARNEELKRQKSERKPDSPPADVEMQPAVAQVRSQLEATRLELENLTKTEANIKAEISMYQSRLNLTPVREQQIASMQRDYDLLKQNYAELLSKEMQSQLAADLEKRQEGQQFRMMEPPNLPSVPAKPNRLKLSAVVIACGFLLGLVAATAAELRLAPYYLESEVASRLDLVVFSFPTIVTRQEVVRRRWQRIAEGAAAMMLMFMLGAAEYYVYLQR